MKNIFQFLVISSLSYQLIPTNSSSPTNSSLTTTQPPSDIDDSHFLNLFFSMQEHLENPLYLCRGNTHGILWQLPQPLECPLLPNVKESSVVDITLWWHDITQQTIKGYECWKEIVTVTKS